MPEPERCPNCGSWRLAGQPCTTCEKPDRVAAQLAWALLLGLFACWLGLMWIN